MADVSYDDLLVPVPHLCTAQDVGERDAAVGDIGLYYPMLYTTLTSAVLDRLLHHADTVRIEGKSYRMKDRIEA